MFTGDGLDHVNWGGTTQPVSGHCPQGLGPHYTFKEDKENGAGICRHARLLSAPDCVRMWPTVSSSCLWHLLSDRVHPGIVNENNPFSAQASFSGSAVLAAGNKTNTASLSTINWQSRLSWQLLFEFFWWQPSLLLFPLLSPLLLTFHLEVGCLRGISPYCLLSMFKNIFNL